MEMKQQSLVMNMKPHITQMTCLKVAHVEKAQLFCKIKNPSESGSENNYFQAAQTVKKGLNVCCVHVYCQLKMGKGREMKKSQLLQRLFRSLDVNYSFKLTQRNFHQINHVQQTEDLRAASTDSNDKIKSSFLHSYLYWALFIPHLGQSVIGK